jgi:hypothetical protein
MQSDQLVISYNFHDVLAGLLRRLLKLPLLIHRPDVDPLKITPWLVLVYDDADTRCVSALVCDSVLTSFVSSLICPDCCLSNSNDALRLTSNADCTRCNRSVNLHYLG